MIHRTKEQETLGERLQKRREALGMSLEQIARDLQAPPRYLQSLEEDNYEIFSAKVYAHGFLKKLLGIIAFPEAENFLKEFNNEWEVRMFRKNQEAPITLRQRTDTIHLNPRQIGLILSGGTFLIILGILGLQFVHFLLSPKLIIEEPPEQTLTEEPIMRIRGRTEKESQLTVNGREITLDGNGNFDTKMELAAGLNALEFLVRDRFGKESKVMRYVLVK